MDCLTTPQTRSTTPASATSLDHRKTSSEKPSRDALERGFRFHDCQPYVDCLERVIEAGGIDAGQANRFMKCGTDAWVVWSPSRHKYTLRLNTCKNRWCPRCQHIAARRIKERMLSSLNDGKPRRWKLVTLTARSSKKPLEDQIKHLRSSFRRLRQRSWWKKRVRGGYCVLETTFNRETRQWHPHLHCVLDSEFLPQHQLSQQWLLSSKDSFIVDVRAIRDMRAAVNDITCYLSKLPSITIFQDQTSAVEFINAMHGTRLLAKFGNVPSISTEPEPPDGVNDWQPVASLATILTQADRGVATALLILHKLKGEFNELDPPESDVPP